MLFVYEERSLRGNERVQGIQRWSSCVVTAGESSKSKEELKMRKNNDGDPIYVVLESRKGDLVAVANRSAGSQALKNQHRGNVMEIEALMNKEPLFRPPMIVLEATRKKNKARKNTKVSGAL